MLFGLFVKLFVFRALSVGRTYAGCAIFRAAVNSTKRSGFQSLEYVAMEKHKQSMRKFVILEVRLQIQSVRMHILEVLATWKLVALLYAHKQRFCLELPGVARVVQ